MNAINKQIIHELTSLHYAHAEEKRKMKEDVNYVTYHGTMQEYYRVCHQEYLSALGELECEKKGLTSIDDYISELSNLTLSKTQEVALKRVRRNPAFIKLMGETALAKKDELQQLLGVTFNLYSGVTLASENVNEPPRQVPKSTLQISKEFDSYYDKLDSLFELGTISEEQYNNFENQLDYISNYFTSISKGDQMRLRKISDKEYENMEELAYMEGISYNEMFAKINQDMVETQKYDIEDFSNGKSR